MIILEIYRSYGLQAVYDILRRIFIYIFRISLGVLTSILFLFWSFPQIALVSGGFWIFVLYYLSIYFIFVLYCMYYRKCRYRSCFFYVLETGNPHVLILNYSWGKDMIRVIIFSSKKQRKAFVITVQKVIPFGY